MNDMKEDQITRIADIRGKALKQMVGLAMSEDECIKFARSIANDLRSELSTNEGEGDCGCPQGRCMKGHSETGCDRLSPPSPLAKKIMPLLKAAWDHGCGTAHPMKTSNQIEAEGDEYLEGEIEEIQQVINSHLSDIEGKAREFYPKWFKDVFDLELTVAIEDVGQTENRIDFAKKFVNQILKG